MSVSVSFEGRRVLVTGGAKGIGLAIVKKFVESEATVFILYMEDEAEVKEVKESLPMVTFIKTDLQDWNKTHKVIEAIGPIHHLVNTASPSSLSTPNEYFMDIKSKSIDQYFGVYFKPMVCVSQAVAKGMIENKLQNATIVNISSISDTVAVAGLGIYSCTKAAVTMLTKVLALELGPYNIRVNCVRPSMVNTGQGAQKCKIYENVLKINDRKSIKRMVEMSEVADSVIFLSSYASSMLTGIDILIDGGISTN